MLTQEAVDEHFKNCITFLTEQPDDLTRLIQEMSRDHQKIIPLVASTLLVLAEAVHRPTEGYRDFLCEAHGQAS